MAPNTENGRVSTREFYNALLDVKEQLSRTERRLMDKIDNLPDNCPALRQVETNTKEIDTLRTRSNVIDSITGLIALIAAGLGLRP